jgi:DNA-binding IclR family transcriptional regulator
MLVSLSSRHRCGYEEELKMTTRKSGTVTKALQILDTFLDSPQGQTLSQLRTKIDINKTTVLRLCATLEEAGLLERDANMAYHLGHKVWQLAQVYRKQFRLEEIVRPQLRSLRDRTGESASFYVRDGDYRVCLYRENSNHPVRHHVDEGARLPLKEGVVGRVLLAFSGELAPEYDQIRSAGYLIAEGRELWTASVAAPVRRPDGSLVGAVVVSGPASRFGKEHQEAALGYVLEKCRQIESMLPEQASSTRRHREAYD